MASEIKLIVDSEFLQVLNKAAKMHGGEQLTAKAAATKTTDKCTLELTCVIKKSADKKRYIRATVEKVWKTKRKPVVLGHMDLSIWFRDLFKRIRAIQALQALVQAEKTAGTLQTQGNGNERGRTLDEGQKEKEKEQRPDHTHRARR